MAANERFAVVWVPAQGSRLAEAGASWSGWCAETAHRVETGSRAGEALAPEVVRERGLHALLAEPFALPSSVTIWNLNRLLADVAYMAPAVTELHLTVGRASEGLVLQPSGGSGKWRSLSAMVAKRVGGLCAGSGPQPVKDMVMQLTGPLPEIGPGTIETYAARHFADALAEPVHVGDIALLAQSGQGRPWSLYDRHLLCGASSDAGVANPLACFGACTMAPLEGNLAF